jgi:CheY-like chemotaxis protein
MSELVIVDSSCERHAEFVKAAQEGTIGLHFCTDGRSALRLSRRFRGDAWLVAVELPDMSGLDLVEMLTTTMPQAAGGLRGGGVVERAAIFLVGSEYRMADEQRALASGVSGYLVRPIALDVIHRALATGSGGIVPSVGVSTSEP